MPLTLANIPVPANTPVDLYAESGLTVGVQMNVAMIGNGTSRLIAIATLTGKPDDASGYRNLESGEEFINDAGDPGAWIWSGSGCTVNVKEVV